MSKRFFQPVRMASQFVATDLQSVIFQASNTDSEVNDGTLVILGDYTKDAVYGDAYTRAGATALAPASLETCYATAANVATAVGVAVIDLPNVSRAIGNDNAYRIGINTIGLVAEAGAPSRARVLKPRDNFWTGSENCTGALTVGQFAVLGTGAGAGMWAPAATAPSTPGCYAKVVDKTTISQGVDGDVTNGRGVTAYRLMIVSN